jgi:hypothetical protein
MRLYDRADLRNTIPLAGEKDDPSAVTQLIVFSIQPLAKLLLLTRLEITNKKGHRYLHIFNLSRCCVRYPDSSLMPWRIAVKYEPVVNSTSPAYDRLLITLRALLTAEGALAMLLI